MVCSLWDNLFGGIPKGAIEVMEKMPFADNSVDVVVGTLLFLTRHGAALGDHDTDIGWEYGWKMLQKSIQHPVYHLIRWGMMMQY